MTPGSKMHRVGVQTASQHPTGFHSVKFKLFLAGLLTGSAKIIYYCKKKKEPALGRSLGDVRSMSVLQNKLKTITGDPRQGNLLPANERTRGNKMHRL